VNKKQRKRREKRAKATGQVQRDKPVQPSSVKQQVVHSSRIFPLEVVKRIWTGVNAAYKLVGGIGLLLTFLAIYTFQPQVSVEEKDYSLDPTNAMQTPFIVRNNGLFPIYSVRLGCYEGRTVFHKSQKEILL